MNERPACDYCDRTITDAYYYEINGDAICQECLDQVFRKELDDDEDQDGSDQEED